MIHSIIVTNHLNESLEIETRFPERSGFLTVDITGLEPPKATINDTELAVQDGARFNSARVGKRNIVFTFVLLPKSTIEDTRQLSYKYFPIKKRINLRVTTDNRVVETYGYVESNQATIFSSKVSTQISIICQDSYLYSILQAEQVLGGVNPLFQFPFSNESLVSNVIEISELILTSLATINYGGEANTGMIINIKALGAATNISLFNENTAETFTLNTSILDDFVPAGLVAGDEIIISTIVGSKYIVLLRDGNYYSLLNGIDKTSVWLQLSPGENLVGFSADTGEENLQISVRFPILYQGV